MLPDEPVQAKILARRSTGLAGGLLAGVALAPGMEGPALHIHEFDQLYLVLDGVLTAELAGRRLQARRHEIVVIPAGVPHRMWNAGSESELHIEVVAPEPENPDVRTWFRHVRLVTGDSD